MGMGNDVGDAYAAPTRLAKPGVGSRAQTASVELIQSMTGVSAEERAENDIEAAPACPPKVAKNKAKKSTPPPKKAPKASAAGKSDAQQLLHQFDGHDLMEAPFYI